MGNELTQPPRQLHPGLVGAGVLRAQGTLRGEPVRSAAEFQLQGCAICTREVLRGGLENGTSTRCAPGARHPRHSPRASTVRAGPSSRTPPTITVDSRTERSKCFCDLPMRLSPDALERADSNMGSSTAGASACLAYTRERRRTRTRLRRLLTALAEREDASCGSVGSGSCVQGLSDASWAALRPPNVHRRPAAI
jgi:hypothetical protein